VNQGGTADTGKSYIAAIRPWQNSIFKNFCQGRFCLCTAKALLTESEELFVLHGGALLQL